MSHWNIFKSGVALAALSAAMAVPAVAQVTTSAIRGTITDDAGAPVSGATVVITHVPSGSVSTSVTNNTGAFSTRGLRVGGPYTVEVSGGDFQPVTVTDIFVNLDDTYELPLTVSGQRTLDAIVVTAPALATAQVAMGPSAAFDLEILQNAPAINRNITDVLRLDARVYVDESRGDINGVQCGGKNSRFNSLTVDGVRLNDNFGLNSNGYPTERIPFSYDAIEQVAVELPPCCG
ncbi:MAG: hypothetical protein CMK06_05555 [Ponticaulis sp.]|nr:hypothetical protein [Ponticaulis sp.]